MELDDFQTRWLAQDRRIEEALRLNKRLWLRAEMAGPRGSLRWLRLGAFLNLLGGVGCLLWTGSFIYGHVSELRFVVPAAALHLWLVASVATAVAQFVKAGAIEYDAPVIDIQRQMAALRRLSLRSTSWLFVFGVPVWFVPFFIVAVRSWMGGDLYQWVGTRVLLIGVTGSIALALAMLALSRRYLVEPSQPWLRRAVRAIAGHYLAKAEDQLASIAAFERNE